ncbi:MAG TPA: response regulator [Thermoanaerobaculia bacterium]|nr:response regulator [Thermoanaerobaculia bacterium]
MSRRILLADDSVTIQKVIELTFMDEDFQVRAVSNGDEAISALSDFRPDFVITDVHMPGANGYEVCRRAKQLFPNIPVLLLVGTFEPFDEAQARSAGSDSFLKKPFDSQELLQRVQDLLAASGPAAPAASAFATPEPSFDLPGLGPEFATTPEPSFGALPDLDAPAAPGFGSPVANFGSPFAAPPVDLGSPASAFATEEPVWSNLELEEPVAAPSFNDRAPATPADLLPPFEEEPPLTLMEDRPFALEDERPPLRFEDDRAFALEEDASLSLDEPITFRDDTATEFTYEEQPQDRFLEEIERPVGVQAPAPPEPEYSWATDEERLGIPIGAAPLVDSLQETEQRIDAAPAYTAGGVAAHEPSSPVATGVAGSESYLAAPPAVQGVYGTAGEVGGHAAGHASGNGLGSLSNEDIERIARRVVELIGEKVVRDIAWEVIPDLAEVVIKDRLRELEAQVE